MPRHAKTSLLLALLLSSSYLLLSTCGGSPEASKPTGEEIPIESAEVQATEDDMQTGETSEPTSLPPESTPRHLDPVPNEVAYERYPGPSTETGQADSEAAPVGPSAAPAQPAPLTVAAGETIDIEFRETLSSHTSQVGQTFRTRVTQPVFVGGKVVIPAGTAILGRVIEAEPAKKIGGRARLALDFESLVLANGATYSIDAVFSQAGKSQTGKDAAIIGGATLGGAVLGKQVGGDTGTLIGAVAGGIGGAFAAKKTKGKPVEVPAGTEMILELTQPVTIDVLP